VLDKAYRLSREIFEPATRAKTSCALAGMAARGGEIRRAEALIQEGLRELPDEPLFALDRVSCLLRGSGVARMRGAAHEAISRAEAAQRLLRESPLQSELMELRTFTNLEVR
jgi:hypothetical protein